MRGDLEVKNLEAIRSIGTLFGKMWGWGARQEGGEKFEKMLTVGYRGKVCNFCGYIVYGRTLT